MINFYVELVEIRELNQQLPNNLREVAWQYVKIEKDDTDVDIIRKLKQAHYDLIFEILENIKDNPFLQKEIWYSLKILSSGFPNSLKLLCERLPVACDTNCE